METQPASGSILGSLVERHLHRVYQLCVRMTLHPDDAANACFETFARVSDAVPPPDGEEGLWLVKIAAGVVAQKLPPTPEVSFALLDETLRSEATRTGEVASLTDLCQRDVLLWEMKQGCMTAVVNCLSPGERVAFVLASVIGLTDEETARVLEIKASALKVRLSRARKKVGDYLAPRCEHVDPRNPCHCPSRIGVALRLGFIAPPAHAEVTLRWVPKFDSARRTRDAVSIYRTLPEPEPPPSLRERIAGAIATGAWQ